MYVTIHTFFPTPVAVVGLERTCYQVSEDVNVVEVCAISNGSITFPFNVSLSTSDGSAGDEH